MPFDSVICVGDRRISSVDPTYFIADIASNHDGNLDRAKDLIFRAAEAGADAAKFQHFKADEIVSDGGFRSIARMSHQKKWNKSVFEVYKDCELNRTWSETLANTATKAGIHFMTSPYDLEAVDMINDLVPAFKIGSGEITWIDALRYIAGKGKPVFLAAGASEMADVERAVAAITGINSAFVLMQCNTNYTGDLENFRYVNLRVLDTFARRWPSMVLGLSDHTPGHATVLGAVALGARVVEKHFTDDNARFGPDHSFSMTPSTWRDMVDRTRELEAALGDGIKRVEINEIDPSVVQRRGLYTTAPLPAGHVLTEADLKPLRPAPRGSIPPYCLSDALGRTLRVEKGKDEYLTWRDLGVNHD